MDEEERTRLWGQHSHTPEHRAEVQRISREYAGAGHSLLLTGTDTVVRMINTWDDQWGRAVEVQTDDTRKASASFRQLLRQALLTGWRAGNGQEDGRGGGATREARDADGAHDGG